MVTKLDISKTTLSTLEQDNLSNLIFNLITNLNFFFISNQVCYQLSHLIRSYPKYNHLYLNQDSFSLKPLIPQPQ